MFRKVISMALVATMLCSLVACGPSKEMQLLQAQYSALQNAPVTPVYHYTVSRPFILMGKMVTDPQTLSDALAARPAMVVCVVQKNEQYADLLCESDMTRAGYQLLGKKTKGRTIELSFKDDSGKYVDAAKAQRQQQLGAVQNQMNQQQLSDSQSRQTMVTVGVTAGTLLIGILGAVLANR